MHNLWARVYFSDNPQLIYWSFFQTLTPNRRVSGPQERCRGQRSCWRRSRCRRRSAGSPRWWACDHPLGTVRRCTTVWRTGSPAGLPCSPAGMDTTVTVRIAFVHDTHTCYCVLFWFRFGYMCENCQTLSSGWGGGGGGGKKSLSHKSALILM